MPVHSGGEHTNGIRVRKLWLWETAKHLVSLGFAVTNYIRGT